MTILYLFIYPGLIKKLTHPLPQNLHYLNIRKTNLSPPPLSKSPPSWKRGKLTSISLFTQPFLPKLTLIRYFWANFKNHPLPTLLLNPPLFEIEENEPQFRFYCTRFTRLWHKYSIFWVNFKNKTPPLPLPWGLDKKIVSFSFLLTPKTPDTNQSNSEKGPKVHLPILPPSKKEFPRFRIFDAKYK